MVRQPHNRATVVVIHTNEIIAINIASRKLSSNISTACPDSSLLSLTSRFLCYLLSQLVCLVCLMLVSVLVSVPSRSLLVAVRAVGGPVGALILVSLRGAWFHHRQGMAPFWTRVVHTLHQVANSAFDQTAAYDTVVAVD